MSRLFDVIARLFWEKGQKDKIASMERDVLISSDITAQYLRDIKRLV